MGLFYCEQEGQLTKEYYENAGLDICSAEDVVIFARDSRVVLTGLFIQIDIGYVGLIWPRSGLSVRNKIEVGAGCIDSNYRGEIMVHLYNHSDENYTISKGNKIAQLLTIPVTLNRYQRVEERHMLNQTDRQDKGFGSSGK